VVAGSGSLRWLFMDILLGSSNFGQLLNSTIKLPSITGIEDMYLKQGMNIREVKVNAICILYTGKIVLKT
jgi:hypothetical protein